MLNYWTICCKSNTDIKNELDNAKKLHGSFFKILSEFDEKIASEYHDRKGSQRFTMSKIFLEDEKEYKNFKAGAILKFNISTYDTRIAKILNKFFKNESIKMLSDKNRSFINLNGTELYFISVKCEVVDKEFLQKTIKNRYRVKFITPTAFRINPCNYPLPDPQKVYKSLNKKYFEIFNEILLSEEEIAEIPKSIALEDLFIKTEEARYRGYKLKNEKREVTFKGFVGEVTFNLKYSNNELKKKVNILSNLIPFIGIGYKSGQGMGKCILL